jgi:hypothetical protein
MRDFALAEFCQDTGLSFEAENELRSLGHDYSFRRGPLRESPSQYAFRLQLFREVLAMNTVG